MADSPDLQQTIESIRQHILHVERLRCEIDENVIMSRELIHVSREVIRETDRLLQRW